MFLVLFLKKNRTRSTSSKPRRANVFGSFLKKNNTASTIFSKCERLPANSLYFCYNKNELKLEVRGVNAEKYHYGCLNLRWAMARRRSDGMEVEGR
jgi:hypothetical protein